MGTNFNIQELRSPWIAVEGVAQRLVLISSEDLAARGRFASILRPRGLTLTRFHSLEQARRALGEQDIFLVFCESRLVDGTYEDLLLAARRMGSPARIVITPPHGSGRCDPIDYERAMDLGAFDVLREFYGPKDIEWIVTCALRDEKSIRGTGTRSTYQ